MHVLGKNDCNCVLCLELNGGEKYTCVSGDGEEKIIVTEQPQKDRKLPFTYFGMNVDTFGIKSESKILSETENLLPSVSCQKETQLVSVDLSFEELDEDFVLQFLENNVINVVYRNTFAYATKIIHEIHQEYYSEDDPYLRRFADDNDSYFGINR